MSQCRNANPLRRFPPPRSEPTRHPRCAEVGGTSVGAIPCGRPLYKELIMAKVTTGTGDTGYTGLLGIERVPKYDPRPDTFGTVDEATSALGLARAMTKDSRVKEIIYRVQNELYLLMGELATTPETYEKMGLR